MPAEMLVAIGEVYNHLGDYGHALVCFRKAIQQDPSIKKAHDDAGSALIRLDRPAEAIAELQAELKLNPGEPDTQYRLAYALLQTAQGEQAMKYCARWFLLTRITPERAMIWEKSCSRRERLRRRFRTSKLRRSSIPNALTSIINFSPHTERLHASAMRIANSSCTGKLRSATVAALFRRPKLTVCLTWITRSHAATP